MAPNGLIIILDFQYLVHYLCELINNQNHEEMATINGPFEFNGSFGNMRCYYDPGTKKWVFGRKGGFTKKQFQTLESLEPQRENASELTGRSKWCSLLYQSLTFVQHLMDIRCWAKIMAGGTIIQRQDTNNPKGLRMIEVGKDLQAITRIEFNELHPLRNVIRDSYVVNFLPDKKTATLTIPGFVTNNDAWWVTKYLAVRLYLVIAQTSDMAYNTENKQWEPIVSDLELLSKKAVTEWMYNNSSAQDVNLTVSLDEAAFSVPGTAVVVALGVEFALSSTNGQPFALPHNGSVAIVKCYNQ